MAWGTKPELCLMNLSRYVWDPIAQDLVFYRQWKLLKKFRKGDSVCFGGGNSRHSV